MPAIPNPPAQNSDQDKTTKKRKMKSSASSVLMNRLDGPHNFYGVTMSREQQVKFLLREQAKKEKKFASS